jgi:5-methylcytosine-specific restriction protein B
MNVVAVYVGQKSQGNLRVGLGRTTWGFKQDQDAYSKIAPGDVVVLGSGFTGGSPRVTDDQWVRHRLQSVWVATVTTPRFHDSGLLWPDESPGGVSYPYRFSFANARELHNVELGDRGPLGTAVSEALRMSAIAQGRAGVLPDPGGFTLTVEDAAPAEPPTPPPTEPDVAEVLASFEGALASAGLGYADDVPLRFLCGVMAKPFVILTGLSGSGKTQIALALGRWAGEERRHIAAVRPDWTGAEALFGYENLLLPQVDGRPAWSVPKELRFMLRAAADPSEPYILILDEMNLAHVERYFADVLSGMESDAEVLPNLGQEPDGAWRVVEGGPTYIPFPRNLIVIGTVNVDETTYQFSPKVLDRATTIEFRVTTDDLVQAAPDISVIDEAPAELRRRLLDRDADSEVSAELQKWITELHRALAAHDREFGHRSFQEMLRFARLATAARPSISDLEVLDFLVMHKVLPRVHGSARELQGVMTTLQTFTRDPGDPQSTLAEPRLRLSAVKLRRMNAELEATHFTAY